MSLRTVIIIVVLLLVSAFTYYITKDSNNKDLANSSYDRATTEVISNDTATVQQNNAGELESQMRQTNTSETDSGVANDQFGASEQLISTKNAQYEEKILEYDQNLSDSKLRAELSESLQSDEEYKNSILKKFKSERQEPKN